MKGLKTRFSADVVQVIEEPKVRTRSQNVYKKYATFDTKSTVYLLPYAVHVTLVMQEEAYTNIRYLCIKTQNLKINVF